MKILAVCNKIIEYSFYTLFLFVPLVLSGNTSELFELNKMWFTFILTIIIGVAWITTMIIQKQIRIQKTPLDIVLLIFLISQIISTLFSLDNRISFWGYYSRFNGGLLSTITYVFLYYAFVSTMSKKQTQRTLHTILLSGLLVVLWGIPSHFGKDPTCFLFRGALDVDCWTEAFRPTIRMFSTLGQPAWLAAYLAALLPISMAMFLKSFIAKANHQELQKNISASAIYFFVLSMLFYLSLLYTNTRAGFLGFWVANIIFWGVLLIRKYFDFKSLIIFFLLFNGSFFLLNFFNGTPIGFLNTFTFSSFTQSPTQTNTNQQPTAASAQEANLNITESGDIRLHVWNGALDAWKANPLFGTGVETFAFAYYKHRPAGHNMTSEWDYLYNKAHNEYLNYLTTTGIVGLGSYLLFISVFILLFLKPLLSEVISYTKKEKSQLSENELNQGLVTSGLFAGFISILITNFFGFSVVITNIYLVLFPAFVFVIAMMLSEKKKLLYPAIHVAAKQSSISHISVSQKTGIGIILFIALWNIASLVTFWRADTSYALGSNLSNAGDYTSAYASLVQAVQLYPDEPVFKDELANTSAQLAMQLINEKKMQEGTALAQQAIELNNEIVTNHPNNIVFLKSQIRIFYTLAQLNEQYLPYALKAAERASQLAPSDAKIWYNLGVLQGQNGNLPKGIETLDKTIAMRPIYLDAYYAKALFYRESALDKNGKIVNPEMQKKAVDTMQYILNNLSPNSESVLKTLKEWGEPVK